MVSATAVLSQAHARFEVNGDLSLRYDDTSTSDERAQYRFRARTGYALEQGISLHAFVATGTEFSSAYNTIDDNDDAIHVRRLFVRFENERGKVEVGTIPTYKGRVSSTGLSENGWLKGLRGVLQRKSGKLELVLGELEDPRAQNALSLAEELNYVELEYSARLTERWSYEFGFEHMLDDDFLRAELRHVSNDGAAWSVEAVHNASASAVKFVVSMERRVRIGARPLDWYIYYAYAEPRFGSRAELTEDFLDFGHALANEVSGSIGNHDRLSWFLKAEVYEDQVRGQAGVEWKFR